MFILNPQSGTPIYRQLTEQVHRLVASGTLAPGDPLPSVRDLARVHAVNPMTISKAYAMLEAEGLLDRNRGKPMTVSAGAPHHVAPARRLAQIESQVAQLTMAARQLQLTKTQVIDLVHRHWERQHA